MLVLVVDDDELVAATVAAALRRGRHRVLVARDLASARRVCARLPLDLVVSDIQMPDGSGLELAAELTVSRPELPVLLISGGYLRSDPEVLAQLGPRRMFLEKPFTWPELFDCVADLMEPTNHGLTAGAAG
jgi:DNA-binding NtrC family response regulator